MFAFSRAAKRRRLTFYPVRTIALSFAATILIGSLLLMLPISSREGTVTPFLDCLFTATSATCVTGLVVYDTYLHWTGFGQVVIIALIQVGGLGLSTLAAFFNLLIGRKMGLRGMHLAQESVAALGDDIRQLLKTVVATALVVESVGALLLMTVFVPNYGLEGVAIAAFTAISAFCNAGFDLMGRHEAYISLCGYADNPLVLGVVGCLIIVGGIGFLVIHDLLEYRRTKKLLLHTRIVLVATGLLILLGTVAIALPEWNNPATLGPMSPLEKIGNSWFHAVSCRTAGFNSFPLQEMHSSTKLFSILLMFMGAAPGSTGGGIKVTTVTVIFMTVWCVIRGDEDTVILGRRIPKGAVYKSLAVAMLGVLGVGITSGCILATVESQVPVSGIDAVFESVSAFATVGLSVGVTGIANSISRLLLILLMYVGRLGPVSFFLALAARAYENRHQVLPEGKIQIG